MDIDTPSYIDPPRLSRRYFLQNVSASLALPCLGSRHGINRETLAQSARSASHHGPRLMEAIARIPLLDYLTLTFDDLPRDFEEKNHWTDELFSLLRRKVDPTFTFYGVWQIHPGESLLHLNCCISREIPDDWLDADGKLLERYWPWDGRVTSITQDLKTPACLAAYFLRFNYPTYLYLQQSQGRNRIQAAKLPKGKGKKRLEAVLSRKFKPERHCYWFDYWLEKGCDKEAKEAKSIERLAIKLHEHRGTPMGKDHREAHIPLPRAARKATTI